MKILYYNNCWFTNVGEAFIDIGAMELIRQVVPDAQIACVSNMSHYYAQAVSRPKFRRLFSGGSTGNFNVFDASNYFNADVLVMSGMFATKEFAFSESRKSIQNLSDKGTRIILLGIGSCNYDETDFGAFSEFLESVNVIGMISRDLPTYQRYKDKLRVAFSGIDCAFFVSDYFNPKGFVIGGYDVVAYNRSPEPEIFRQWRGDVIRPFHFQYSLNKKDLRQNILISDSPYDYLTVYANAKKVYTDLVHATIISLMYGVPVRYEHNSKRSVALQAVEPGLDKENFMVLSSDSLVEKKEKQKNNLKTIFSCL